MNMEQPIKIEGEYFGFQTDSGLQNCFERNFLQGQIQKTYNFYEDQDQIEQDIAQHIVCRLSSYTNLALTPMQDLLNIAQQDQHWSGANHLRIRKTLWKRKIIQKRERARGRKLSGKSTIQLTLPVQLLAKEEAVAVEQQDIKRKKNRLSAQNSRDRKKSYYTKLQIENQQLKQKILDLSKANQSLESKKTCFQPTKKRADNIFKSLLIFLGLIFLFNLLKGIPIKKAVERPKIQVPIEIKLSKFQKNLVSVELKAMGISDCFDFEQQSCRSPIPALKKGLSQKLAEIRANLF